MNQLQLSILMLCNHIADVRKWDITTTFDCGYMRIDFTCYESEQQNCDVNIAGTESEIELNIIFANILDLLHGNTIFLKNGSLNCEKLND